MSVTYTDNESILHKDEKQMRYLIDMGSSTIKIYGKNEGNVSLLETKTFDFKDGFKPSYGLSDVNKGKLYAFFEELFKRFSFNRYNTKLYATGIFREIVNKQSFIEEFYFRTRLLFNIISHDLEAFYLGKAWIGKYSGVENLLVINIGGKTTELIIYNQDNILDRKMLTIGVGTILKKYPYINKDYSSVSINKVVDYVCGELPPIMNIVDIAIYTGGELKYMQVAGYTLQENTVFTDEKHPSMIKFEEYSVQNQKIFSQISIDDLRNMMPDNPGWMNGARPCSAIAQAICLQYGIRKIIPSDSNLVDGVNVQEVRSIVVCGDINKQKEPFSQLFLKFKNCGIDVLNRDIFCSNNDVISYSALAKSICKQICVDVSSHSNLMKNFDLIMNNLIVVICGSFNRHLEHIAELITELKKLGVTVISPKNTEIIGSENGFMLFKNDKIINRCTWSVEASHLKAIDECDYVIFCDFDNYLGSKTSLEIGYTKKCGKPILFCRMLYFNRQ